LRLDGPGELTVRACDPHHMLILNDRFFTFSSGPVSLIIDIIVASRELALVMCDVCDVSTESNPCSSDHMSVNIIHDIKPSLFRSAYKLNLSKSQLT